MFRIQAIILALIFWIGQAVASNDNYGLIYLNDPSQEVTSIDVTGGEKLVIQDSLRLNFKFSAYFHRIRFGYIARLIFNNSSTLNFIVNITQPGKQSIMVVSDGTVLVDEPILSDGIEAYIWNEVSLSVTPGDGAVAININGSITECKLPLAAKSDVRILFGANNIDGFVVKDVPSIILRDLELQCNNTHKLWRLHDHTADTTIDEISGEKLEVKSPLWERDLHSSWKLEKESIRNSWVYPVYNGKNKIHIISSGGVWDYNIEAGNGKWRKFETPIELRNLSNQFVFDEKSNRIRYFDSTPSGDFHSSLNNNTIKWEPQINRSSEASYHQGNIFISPIDGLLTQLFGYGFFRYKSTKFTTTMQGVTKRSELDSITPRYLASTALVGDYCYVYGGIGNGSGRQELGSQNLRDLHRIDLRTNISEKIWTVDKIAAEEVACQNMIVMPDNPDYGISLFYNPSVSSSELKLKAINLKEPEIVELLHDSIPYNFSDVESNTQLIYAKSLSKLFAIIVDKISSEEYRLRIYSIAYPIVNIAEVRESGDNNMVMVVVIGVLLLLGVAVTLYYIRRKRAAVTAKKTSISESTNQPQPRVEIVERDITIVPRVKRTGIYLLDGFTIIDREQNDITNEFAPLMKQLLSLIILYTHKNGKGVSNTILKDVLWFDKSDASARNNRSVTISKIRQSLQKVGGYQIVFNNSYWHIEYTEGDFCDYAYACQTIEMIESTAPESQVMMLSEVAQMGDLLPNQMFDFFDGFKAEYASMVIDSMNDLLRRSVDQNDKITLANLILRFDKIDESATREKCLALIALGKNGVAKTTFDNFTREYATLFGEEFESSFDEFVKD